MGKKMNHNHLGGFFFFFVGISIAFYASSIDIGTLKQPGPGFMPFLWAITLAAMSVLLLLGTMIRKHTEPVPSFFTHPNALRRISVVVLSLIAFVFLLHPLGFTLSTFFFIGFLVRFVFPQTLRTTVLAAILTALGARLLFINFLETQLPKGFLGF